MDGVTWHPLSTTGTRTAQIGTPVSERHILRFLNFCHRSSKEKALRQYKNGAAMETSQPLAHHPAKPQSSNLRQAADLRSGSPEMEVHQLRYFCAIVKTGTFTRAAESEHVAQPSLSQQILKLEDELGGKLFYRLPRKARLTPLGERFLPRAQAILQGIRDAQADISSMVQLTHSQPHSQAAAMPLKQPSTSVTNNGKAEIGNRISVLRKSA